MNRHTYILISTHFYHRPRWQNWLGLHSVNSMVVGSNPTASNSKFCYFFILALPFSLLFPPFSLPSQRNFPISFKPKVAIANFFWKMQRKTWYFILGLDTITLSLKNLLLNNLGLKCFANLIVRHLLKFCSLTLHYRVP